MTDLVESWQYRALLVNFIRRDLKVRYKNSFLGFAWSLLNPLCQMLVYVLVFRYLYPVPTPNYSVKLLVAMLPWLFFSQALMDGASSVASQVFLLKKVYFPRLLIPMATMGSNLVHFFLGLAVLAAYLALRGVTVQWVNMPLVVVGLLLQTTFLFGLVLLTSAVCVYYNDIKFMLGTIVQMWLFLSPVMIPPELALHGIESRGLPAFAKALYMLNPMAPPLIAYRSLIPQETGANGGNNYLTLMGHLVPNLSTYYYLCAAISLVVLVIGFLVFRRLQWHFAEQG